MSQQERAEAAKNWLSRHGDTLAIIGVVCCGFLWADNKIDRLSERVRCVEIEINNIKTIMIIQGIYPKDLLAKGEQ